MKYQATRHQALKLAALIAAALPATLSAQTTLSQTVALNTYVSSGQPNNNFGTMGAMEIAGPTTAQPRTEETLIQFNTAALQTQFNADYGPGNWAVTAVTLTQRANFPTGGIQPGNTSFNIINPGGFELDLLSDNNWSQTAITWNNISSVLPGTGGNTSTSLGDFTYAANGVSPETWSLGLAPGLVNDIDTGGAVTIFGQPTAGSTVGYLFNTASQGNPAVLNVTVAAVPEPGTMALMASALVELAAVSRRKKHG
jgi:hypothetical protein